MFSFIFFVLISFSLTLMALRGGLTLLKLTENGKFNRSHCSRAKILRDTITLTFPVSALFYITVTGIVGGHSILILGLHVFLFSIGSLLVYRKVIGMVTLRLAKEVTAKRDGSRKQKKKPASYPRKAKRKGKGNKPNYENKYKFRTKAHVVKVKRHDESYNDRYFW